MSYELFLGVRVAFTRGLTTVIYFFSHIKKRSEVDRPGLV